MPARTLYVGTHRRAYRNDPLDIAFGIYSFRQDESSENLSATGLAETPQPGWLAPHPNGRFLYAANEVGNFEGIVAGGLSAFAVDSKTGSLSILNSVRTPPLPCHCVVDASGRYLVLATYGGGTVHLYRLLADGGIGIEADAHRHSGSSVNPHRQAQPHPHAVVLDAANRFVLVPDLGTDRIVVYELDLEAAKLVARPERDVSVAPGSGPRHVVFHPQGRFVYLMNEMSATIVAFAWNSESGALQKLMTEDTLPRDFAGLRSGAAIGVHPSGRFLYATTRSHGSSGEPPVRGLDSVVWFEIDQEQGTLRFAGRVPSGGEIPRAFAFDTDGDHLFVGHQSSGSIVTFRLDEQTGAPVALEKTVSVPVPVCLLIQYAVQDLSPHATCVPTHCIT